MVNIKQLFSALKGKSNQPIKIKICRETNNKEYVLNDVTEVGICNDERGEQYIVLFFNEGLNFINPN